MKAFIHIGMAKVGSTSIQTWLNLNRDNLRKVGVYSLQEELPRRGLWNASLHLAMREIGVEQLMANLWPINDFGDEKKKMIEEHWNLVDAKLKKLSGEPGIFVYSAENIYGLQDIRIIALDKMLSLFFQEITYIVYIRDTVDHYISQYSEKLRLNVLDPVISFSKILEKFAEEIYPYGYKYSLERIFVWDKVIGERLMVRLLESDFLLNSDLIEDFASVLGVDAFRKPEKMRESFAAEYIEYVRFLNSEFGESLPKDIRRNALEILSTASAGKPKLSASDAQAVAIHATNRHLEGKIRKKFFPDRPFLFSPKRRGDGVAPAALTERRKAAIQTQIREKIGPAGWKPYDLARYEK